MLTGLATKREKSPQEIVLALENLLSDLTNQRRKAGPRKSGNLTLPISVSEKELEIKQLIQDIKAIDKKKPSESRVKIGANLNTDSGVELANLLSKARELLAGSKEDIEAVRHNYQQAIRYIDKARSLGMPIRSIFSGANSMAEKPEYNSRVLPKIGSIGIGSMASNIDTGVDYRSKSENPLKRFKFYHSFDISASSKLIETYLQEVYEACVADGVSLQIKTEDHFYDACNLYTWDFEKLVSILQKLYPKYKKEGLFASCERVFQCGIDCIDPAQIAYVQEPAVMKPFDRKDLNSEEERFTAFANIHDIKGCSHSTRMLYLGRLIEDIINKNDGKFSKEDFIAACKQIGVKPESPWLLDI